MPRYVRAPTLGSMKKLLPVLAVAGALTLLPAAPSQAIVGGTAAPAGAYPSIAEVTFGGGSFLCTGTLIAPNYVLSAGHCGSVTGGTGVGSPASWPASTVTVRIGGTRRGAGERVPVSSVTVHPNYLLNPGYDIALIKLTTNSTKAPTPIAGAPYRSIWEVGDLQKIVGWGATSEGGPTPTALQHAQVPINSDAVCADAYSEFDQQSMVCAGYPEGGVDTCQGDSGGPMFGTTSTGALRVTGATSFGDGCARAGSPGVYARVADPTLREWIRARVPAGVDG
jgi:trypsin